MVNVSTPWTPTSVQATSRVRHRWRPRGSSQAVRSYLPRRHGLPQGLAVPGGGGWATCSFWAACRSEWEAGARGAEGPPCRLPTVSAGDIRGARVGPRLAQGSPVHGHLSLHGDLGNNEVPTQVWVLPGDLGVRQ